jgi:hypothetical protein
MKRTWKIGEYAKGGVIKAVIRFGKVRISCHDYFTDEELFDLESNDRNELQDALWDWTTPYYADLVIEWIESKVGVLSYADNE